MTDTKNKLHWWCDNGVANVRPNHQNQSFSFFSHLWMDGHLFESHSGLICFCECLKGFAVAGGGAGLGSDWSCGNGHGLRRAYKCAVNAPSSCRCWSVGTTRATWTWLRSTTSCLCWCNMKRRGSSAPCCPTATCTSCGSNTATCTVSLFQHLTLQWV